MDRNRPRPASDQEETKDTKQNGSVSFSDPNKLKQKVLSSDSLDKLPFAFDDEILEEEDEDDEKLNPESPLSESFILINKENLGDGSSRSKIV